MMLRLCGTFPVLFFPLSPGAFICVCLNSLFPNTRSKGYVDTQVCVYIAPQPIERRVERLL